jgi:hypothetical protein
MAEPSKIEQAEANVAVLQAALDEAQRVLRTADEAQKTAQMEAARMRKVATVVGAVSGVVVLLLMARHRRLARAHRRQLAAPVTLV